MRPDVSERLQLVAMGCAVMFAPLLGVVLILAAIPVIGRPFMALLERLGFGR